MRNTERIIERILIFLFILRKNNNDRFSPTLYRFNPLSYLVIVMIYIIHPIFKCLKPFINGIKTCNDAVYRLLIKKRKTIKNKLK